MPHYLYKIKFLLTSCLAFILLQIQALSAQDLQELQAEVKDCMHKATGFMMDELSQNGGFVSSYLPDLSRRWGELEAYPSMIWIDGPTPAMGNILLDAWQVLGDEYYYRQAYRVAEALMAAQLPCGGWNYIYDFAGEASLKQWYATIGKNAWGVSEFNYYYGNATFDDETTHRPSMFLLRLYLINKETRIKQALDRAIDFHLQSQYPNGGWPQRYPLRYDYPAQDGSPDYSSFITINDEVMEKNIEFMLCCYYLLEDERCLKAAEKAWDCLLMLKQEAPTAGWALQYDLNLQPARARDYEPASVCVSTTVSTMLLMMDYYRLTGEDKFMRPLPEVLDFLQAVAFSDSMLQVIALDARNERYINNPRGALCPRMLVPGSFTPLFLHRRGSHINNGTYYIDQNPHNTLWHYSSFCNVNVEALRKHYEFLLKLPKQELCRYSPLLHPELRQQPSFLRPRGYRPEAILNPPVLQTDEYQEISELIASLNQEYYWPAPLTLTTNPYIGEGSARDPIPELYEATLKHPYNTQFYFPDHPEIGITVNAYIKNMKILIQFLQNQKNTSYEK